MMAAESLIALEYMDLFTRKRYSFFFLFQETRIHISREESPKMRDSALILLKVRSIIV